MDNPFFTPADLAGYDPARALGEPGHFPFTRGITPSGYRARPWTIRQFSGYGTPRETNRRYRYLLDSGAAGLSIAFDLPTLYGYDSDDPRARGEVGKCGVAVDSLKDMETILDGIPLDRVSTSMTINGPASVIFAMYLAVAEHQGVPLKRLSGTLQNDILKEYLAQNEYLYPVGPSLRLVTDVVEHCTRQVPRWNPISISGYHIREAGSTAAQELAFTLADGFVYVGEAIRRGLDVDEFAPRLTFFFNSHNDFFEEIAKYRAARRIWARGMKERYHAKNPLSWMLKFHTQTAGCTLTAQQPENNLVRTALQALAGILGGTQSLHTNALDETLSLPSERAALLAVRTQQILQHEAGLTGTVDPLGGSYYLESLTNRLERDVESLFAEIERQGGVVGAIQSGYFHREIQASAYAQQKLVETNQQLIVGVNAFQGGKTLPVTTLKIGPRTEREQVKNLNRLRKTRDEGRVRSSLDRLRTAARGTENTLPATLDCVKAYATLGEICGVFREVFGEYSLPGS